MNLVLGLSGKFKSLVKMVKIDKNTKIVVLLGGNSSEREISISSGENVIKSLISANVYGNFVQKKCESVSRDLLLKLEDASTTLRISFSIAVRRQQSQLRQNWLTLFTWSTLLTLLTWFT